MPEDLPTSAVPTAGIDWATDTNQLCIVDAAGRIVADHSLTMDAGGIRRLVGELEAYDLPRVAIERPDGPVVDALLDVGLEVVVITPWRVRGCVAATARRATRLTGSMRSCSLTRCAPTPAFSSHCV